VSIRGNDFTGYPTGPHLEVSAGNGAGLYSGAFSVVLLQKTNSDTQGLFGGWSGGVGSTFRGGMLLVIAKLFGMSDFSSGFGPGDYNDSVFRWLGYSKVAGSAHYRMHVADLATLTWSHGESTGAGNHGDTGTCDTFTIGMDNNYVMGNNTSHIAAGAAWTSAMSDAAFEAACTKFASDLAASGPAMGWLFPEATSGSAIQDFTGGGANETSRSFISTSPDPVDFDFSLGGRFLGGDAAPFFM
jgi:hypothetical protein